MMYIKWKKYLLILLILVIGCNPSTPSIISNTSCEAPCWREISPGQTTKADLLSKINGMADINPDTITVLGHPWNNFDDVVYFYLSTNEKAEIYILDDKVALISFFGKQLATFEQAAEEFGEPDFVINIPSFGPGFLFMDARHDFITGLKPEKGIEYGYDTYYVPKSHRSEIRPDIKIQWIGFFDPGLYDILLEGQIFTMGMLSRKETMKRIKPWSGYGLIEEKYPPTK